MEPVRYIPPGPSNTGRDLPNSGRTRVRTGCSTCRAKKVKCDEQRPNCSRCIRLKRTCTYKLKAVRDYSQPTDAVVLPNSADRAALPSLTQHHLASESPNGLLHDYGVDILVGNLDSLNTTLQHGSAHQSSAHSSQSIFHIHRPHNPCDEAFLQSPAIQASMTSQDIYLCTTNDFMAIADTRNQAFRFFIDEVWPPLISSFDRMNWARMKTNLVALAHNRAVASAILALQSLYKAQFNGLPSFHAMRLYHTARKAYHNTLDAKEMQDPETALINRLFLALFEMLLLEETGSGFDDTDEPFVRVLAYLNQARNHSPVTRRLVAWLVVIHVAARRGGNPGIFSKPVFQVLNKVDEKFVGLTDIATSAFDVAGAPVQAFYLELTKISAQIADQSHYHRSRTTSADQEEVDVLMDELKRKLSDLWRRRPEIMTLPPSTIRERFPPDISEPLISLLGFCIATYHTEIVEHCRTLSEPPFASRESKQAMHQIREIVEGDWNAVSSTDRNGKLDPGYMRPLFLYAIESLHPDDTQWAVARLRQIKDPICRSDFFADYAESLSEAQRRKGRRVTTKYFCLQNYGVATPVL